MCDTAISVSSKGRATSVLQIENLHRQHQSEELPPCKDHKFKKNHISFVPIQQYFFLMKYLNTT